jgi:hypothetical protein
MHILFVLFNTNPLIIQKSAFPEGVYYIQDRL